MNEKLVITYLIKQEMKYSQVIFGLRNLTFESDSHAISLLEPILHLMGVPINEGGSVHGVNFSDNVYSTYVDFMEKAQQYKIGSNNNGLDQLAEACYYSLVAALHIESKQKTGSNE